MIPNSAWDEGFDGGFDSVSEITVIGFNGLPSMPWGSFENKNAGGVLFLLNRGNLNGLGSGGPFFKNPLG